MLTLEIIENQLKNKEFKIVNSTFKRLSSLNLDKQQVMEYLCWAYDQSLDENRDLDLTRYTQNLNQLPATHALVNPNQVIQEISMEQMVNLLNSLMNKKSIPEVLEGVEVVTYVFQVKLADGFEMMASLLESMTLNALCLALAQREGIQYENPTIQLSTGLENILCQPHQKEMPLSEFELSVDDEINISFNDKDKVTLTLVDIRMDSFSAIEFFQKL